MTARPESPAERQLLPVDADRALLVGRVWSSERIDGLARPRWGHPDIPLRLLAPVDLQCLKACGVTFAASVLERVFEEQARGNPDAAEAIRSSLQQSRGDRLNHVEPGNKTAAAIKRVLVAEGLWSPYL